VGVTSPVVEREIPNLIVTEREHTVPLDHSRAGDGAEITVFSRELAAPDGRERPLLVYFEGGPGSEAPRPSRVAGSPPWLERALSDFRVLMLDQRGTGRSTPLKVEAASGLADYLSYFQADSIVADAEAIRAELGVERWSVLGQSFGGFCAMRYLSVAPEALTEVLFTGGVPPLEAHIDDVYRATLGRMRQRNERFYERYPEDRDRYLALLERARRGPPPTLPGGDPLTVQRVRQLGQVLGMSDGYERLHYLLELDPSSPAFLHDAEQATTFARNPIYAILHEACWANGGSTRWSARRMFEEEERSGWPEEYMTGEHVFPEVFDAPSMAPLREAAHLLAEREWPMLYDRDALSANTVPAAAAVYAEDPYVERSFSEQAAAEIPGLHVWLTNEYDHDGLRRDGERVLGRLLDVARGRI
jgi:pimeloyl-ACP methyl ester carboxylesterase